MISWKNPARSIQGALGRVIFSISMSMHQCLIKTHKAVVTNSCLKPYYTQECHAPTFKQVCFDLGIGKGARNELESHSTRSFFH